MQHKKAKKELPSQRTCKDLLQFTVFTGRLSTLITNSFNQSVILLASNQRRKFSILDILAILVILTNLSIYSHTCHLIGRLHQSKQQNATKTLFPNCFKLYACVFPH